MPGRGSRRTRPRTKGKAKIHPLTDKQELFVEEYCVDLNAAAAARRAGLSPSYTGRLMTDRNITNAIRERLGERAKKTRINAERVLLELAMIAFSNPANYMFDRSSGEMLHPQDMPEDVQRSIASMDVVNRETENGITTTVKIKFWNKMEALNMIGKHLGILGNDLPQQHLHLHSNATNPYLNAPPELILQAKEAMTKLEHSVKAKIDDEDDSGSDDNTVDGQVVNTDNDEDS